MSPRSRQATMAPVRVRSEASRKHTHRQIPRTVPDVRSSNGLLAHDISSSHFPLHSQHDVSNAGPPFWNEHPSMAYPDGSDASYDAVSIDTYMQPYMMSMPMDSCYDAPEMYNAVSNGPMSQTLAGPYQEDAMGEEMLQTSPIAMEPQDYTRYQQATFRHGLPSPPRDVFVHDYHEDFSMDPMCDIAFPSLPGSALVDDAGLDRSTTCDSRTHGPRPIRSASERDIMSQNPPALLDTQYSRDDRVDKVKARNDPRYDQGPDKDGYYHCPLLGDGSCSHKPTKQKCIYAKYLDSHLKPYVCKHGKDKDCENLRFSSNACLFRHEREAHGLHNHGLNPYLCMYTGCDRANKNNGFPRRWNQRDHMKRVHDWIEPDEDPKYGTTETTKRRKTSGSSNSVQMKRSSSSHARAQAATYAHGSRQATSMSRYHAQMEKELQECSDIVAYPVSMSEVQYTQAPSYQQQARTSPSYPGSAYAQLVC